MGGLSPVLHALPLSALPAGVPRRPFPTLASRLARGNHAARVSTAAQLSRPLPPRRPHARPPPQPPRAALRRASGGREERAPRRRLSQRPHRGERPRAGEARSPPFLGARGVGLDRLQS